MSTLLPFGVTSAAVALVAVVVAGNLLQRLAARLTVAPELLYLLFGFVASELAVMAGLDTGLRWYHFSDLAVYLLVPILAALSVSRLDRRYLVRDWAVMLAGGTFAAVLAIALGALLLFVAIGHPAGFPWITAILAASLLLPGDPRAPGTAHLAGRRLHLLEGESAIADVIGITVVGLALTLALAGTVAGTATMLGGSLLAAVASGLLIGWCGRGAAKALGRPRPGRPLRIAVALVAYLACQWLAGAAGALAALVSVLAMPAAETSAEAGGWTRTLEVLGWIVRLITFSLAGATFTVFMFVDQWLAMLIAFAAVLLSRVAALGLLLFFDRRRRVGWRTSLVSDPRGAVVLALALSLPLDFAAWYTVQAMAYGVVLGWLLLQSIAVRGVKIAAD